VKLVLVSLLCCIEFDDSALEDLKEVKKQTVVGLLLMPSGKTRVYRH